MSSQKKISISKSVVGAAVILGDMNTSSRVTRERVPTVKGALYAQDLAKENQVTNAKLGRRGHKKQPLVSVAGDSDTLAQFAPEPEDPFEPLADAVEHHPTPVPRKALQATDNLPFKSVMVYPRTLSRPSTNKDMTRNNSNPHPTPAFHRPTVSNSPHVSAPSRLLQSVNNALNSPCASQNSVATSVPVPFRTRKRSVEDDSNSGHSDGSLIESYNNKLVTIKPQRKRAKAADIPYQFQGLLKFAIADYRSTLATQCPYPDYIEEHAYAESILSNATRLLKVPIDNREAYSLMVELIIARDTHMRSELRAKMIPLVSSHYGFNNSGMKQAILANQKLHTALKNGDSFLFQEPEKRHGLYENPILQAAINEMWFRDTKDEGVKFNAYFEPVPLKTMALVFTVIEYVIDQWVTGIYRQTTNFTAKEYHNVYERHLGSLEATKAYSSTSSSKLLRIQRRLYSRACKFAGLKPKKELVILNDEDIAAFEQSNESKLISGDSDKESEADNEMSEPEDLSASENSSRVDGEEDEDGEDSVDGERE